MLVAVLNSKNVITDIQDISDKGIADGYRPSGIVVDAQPDWEAGGKVVNGVYTAPVVDFGPNDDEVISLILTQPGVLRALATVLFKDMKTRTPSLTVAQFKAMLKAEIR